MELLQLKYFLTTAKLEQITKAAKILNIAQPSLSKTITRLEEHIGVPLFDRQGRNIRLNAYGAVLLKRVERAFQELEEAQNEIRDMAGLDRGIITVAGGPTLTNHLTEMLLDFFEPYPDVNFRQVVLQNASVMKQMLENGEIDMCITFAPIEGPDIEWKLLRTEKIHLFVPDHHPLAGRESVSIIEVKDESFIGPPSGTWFRDLTDSLCMKAAGFTPKTKFELEEINAVFLLIKQGFGITFSPDFAWRMDQTPNKVRITDLGGNITLGLAWSKRHYLSSAAQKFHEFVIDYFSGEGMYDKKKDKSTN